MSENNPVGLAIFLKNVSFHGILLDALFEAGNSEWEEVRIRFFSRFNFHYSLIYA